MTLWIMICTVYYLYILWLFISIVWPDQWDTIFWNLLLVHHYIFYTKLFEITFYFHVKITLQIPFILMGLAKKYIGDFLFHQTSVRWLCGNIFQEYLGHKYSLTQFGIPTFCEFCSNIIWIMEKGSVCQGMYILC